MHERGDQVPTILLITGDRMAGWLSGGLLAHGYRVLRLQQDAIAEARPWPAGIDLVLGEIRSPHDPRLWAIDRQRALSPPPALPMILIGEEPSALPATLRTLVTWVDLFAPIGGILAAIRASLPHPPPLARLPLPIARPARAYRARRRPRG